MGFFRCLVLFCAVAAAPSGFAGPAQKPIPLPDISYKRLLNDLQLVVASSPQLGDTISIGLVLRYGAIYDPAGKGGLTHLVCRMLGKATLDRTAKDIQTDLQLLGATLEIRPDWDGIRFVMQAPAAQFERSLLLLYQMVGEAQFTEPDFAAAKSDLLKEAAQVTDPRQRIRQQFEAVLFKATSYARPISGTPESIQQITLGDVRLYYRRYFSPSAAALVMAGSVSPDQILPKATRIWGVWVRRDDVPFTFLPPSKPAARNIYFEDDPSSPAAQYIIGNLWPRREDREYFGAELAARILQDRLTKMLPTSLVTVAAEPRRMPGLFYIQGQAAADQALGQIQRISEVVESLKTGPVSAEELDAAQKAWIEEFASAAATSGGLCRHLVDSELYRLGTNYLAVFPDMIRRSSAESVQEAAKEWLFPGGMVIVVRGPAAPLKPGLEALGTVQPVAE